MRALGLLSVSSLILAPACASLVGVSDIPTPAGSDAAADAPESDATLDGATESATTDGPTADAHVDGASDAQAVDASTDAAHHDAGHDAAEACVDAGPEVCTNGVDDDCNGLTDCADPACTGAGFACVPGVPSGFSFEGVDTSDTASCPAGLTQGDAVVSATGGSATCNCTCGPGQPPTCLYGTIATRDGTASCGPTGASYDATGACVMVGGVEPGVLQGSAQTPMGGSCAAAPTKTIPTASVTRWRTCGYGGPFGAGCAAGQVCAPVPAGQKVCVSATGAVTCPTTYPSSTPTGSGVSDTRDCTACTCAAPSQTCGPSSLEFFATTTCGTPAVTVALDGFCNTVGATTYNAYQVVATPTQSCNGVQTAPMATGSIGVSGPTTTCCVP